MTGGTNSRLSASVMHGDHYRRSPDEQEIVQSDLLNVRLRQQRAFPLYEAFMDLDYLVGKCLWLSIDRWAFSS